MKSCPLLAAALLIQSITLLLQPAFAADSTNNPNQLVAILWAKLLTKCDGNISYLGSYKIWTRTSSAWDSDGIRWTGAAGGAVGLIGEFKDVSFKTVVMPLSEADHLNGLEWQGYTELFASAYRFKYPQDGNFGEWESIQDRTTVPNVVINIMKRNGRWIFANGSWTGGVTVGEIQVAKPSCATPLLPLPPLEK